MLDRVQVNELMVATLRRVKGIVEAQSLPESDLGNVLEIEQDAEDRSLMGLGKVVNVGVREVASCDLVYVALTSMEFDWGCQSSLVLKKGDEVVGKEVRDEDVIAELSDRKDVWFMHKNFVVFKEKLSFPRDIVKKICHFEIPCLPAEWCVVEDDNFTCNSIVYANPSTPCDVFLKEKYFRGAEEKGLGTILVGVKM